MLCVVAVVIMMVIISCLVDANIIVNFEDGNCGFGGERYLSDFIHKRFHHSVPSHISHPPLLYVDSVSYFALQKLH